MKDFKIKSNFNTAVHSIPILFLSTYLSNCSINAFHPININDPSTLILHGRLEHLSHLDELSGYGQIGIDSPAGNVSLGFDFEYHTAETLYIKIQDLLGRGLANLELSGDTYHLQLVREGKYFTGTQIETDHTPLPIGTFNPAIIRQILLAAPMQNESSGCRYKYYHGSGELAEILFEAPARYLQINYKKYVEVTGFRLPREILINEKMRNLSVVIHFSHFNSGMLKF